MKTSADLCVLISETVCRNALFHHVVIQPLTFLKDNSGAKFNNVSISIYFTAITCCSGNLLPRVHIWHTTKRLLFQIHLWFSRTCCWTPLAAHRSRDWGVKIIAILLLESCLAIRVQSLMTVAIVELGLLDAWLDPLLILILVSISL